MKNKNLKFTQFEREQVLSLHKPAEKKEVSINESILKNEEEKSLNEEDQGGSDNDKKDDQIKESDDKNRTTVIKDFDNKDVKQHQSSPTAYKYYYEKYLFHDRNMTIDLQKNKRPYFSSFKTVSRDRQEYVDNKMKYAIPGVGKYYPKFKVTEQIQPIISMTKAELHRTRNLLFVDNYNSRPGVHQSPSQQILDKNFQNNKSMRALEQRSQSVVHHNQLNNYKQKTLDHKILKQALDHRELIIEDHDQSFDNSSTINLNNQKNNNNSVIYHSNRSIGNSHSPKKMREGWDNAHGMLDLNKQSERKFVFENLIRVNEQRFNYLQLPQIFSKNKKVVGDANFSKGSSRKGLFKLPQYQPSYTPNYDLTSKKNPQLVNMNVKYMKEIYHNIS